MVKTIIFYFFKKDLKFFPIYGQSLHMRTTTEFSYHYRNQKCQTLTFPAPGLLGCDHMLSNHLYPLQTLKLMDKEARPIGNSFMCRQSYIYFLGAAVVIAPSSSVGSSIGDFGYIKYIPLLAQLVRIFSFFSFSFSYCSQD